MHILKPASFILAALMCTGLVSCADKTDTKTEGSSPAVAAAEETTEITEKTTEVASILKNSVDLVRVFSYSGKFVEDGSNDRKSNILAAEITNRGEEYIRLLEFEISDGTDTYSFSATTLFPGDSVTVLEKNGKEMPEGFTVRSVKATRAVDFEKQPSLNNAIIRLEEKSGQITVTNISTHDISDVCIYYKAKSNNEYLGGITYRVNVGALKPNEANTVEISGYSTDNYEIKFTSYENTEATTQ